MKERSPDALTIARAYCPKGEFKLRLKTLSRGLTAR